MNTNPNESIIPLTHAPSAAQPVHYVHPHQPQNHPFQPPPYQPALPPHQENHAYPPHPPYNRPATYPIQQPTRPDPSISTVAPSQPSSILNMLIAALLAAVVSVPATFFLIKHKYGPALDRQVDDSLTKVIVIDPSAIIEATVRDPSVQGDKSSVAITRIQQTAKAYAAQGYLVFSNELLLAAPPGTTVTVPTSDPGSKAPVVSQ